MFFVLLQFVSVFFLSYFELCLFVCLFGSFLFVFHFGGMLLNRSYVDTTVWFTRMFAQRLR